MINGSRTQIEKRYYFNSSINWSISDHVFWSKYSLFGLKLDQYKILKDLKKKKMSYNKTEMANITLKWPE